MNITLIGRGEMLLAIAKAVLSEGHKINLIITAKESPEHTVSATDLEAFAKEINTAFLNTPKINTPETIEVIKNVSQRDIALSVNYSSIIPQNIIDEFTHGVLNAHGGDLPRYKGNACQAWAIINGEQEIGLCVHKMAGGKLDEGKIITRDYLPIDINTKIGTIYQWMNDRIPFLMIQAINVLKEKPAFYIEDTLTQTVRRSLRCYPRNAEDGKIDWRKTNIEILRLINASSAPFSGAYCIYEEKILRIWDAELTQDDEEYLAIPGQVAITNKSTIEVICGSGKIRLKEIEYEQVRTKDINMIISTIRKRLK